MIDHQELFDALAAPFPIECISWRIGSTNERWRKPDEPLKGRPLCYIDARIVMDRLDSVVGFDGWQCTYTPGVGSSIICNIGLCFPVIYDGNQIGHQWVWKGDGAGPSDIEPEKGALSDAFKRAAVRWGIGRYLYDIEAPEIELEKRGNSTFIPKTDIPKLNAVHDEMARRSGWGEGAGIAAYRLLLSSLEHSTTETRTGFEDRHKGQIAMLPPAMRRHLISKLEKAA